MKPVKPVLWYQGLFLHPQHGIPSRETPFIETFYCKYVIESASLIPIKPEPMSPRPSGAFQPWSG